MANFNNSLIQGSPIQPFNYNMGTYVKTFADIADQEKRSQINKQYQDRQNQNNEIYQRTMSGASPDFGNYKSELEKAGLRKVVPKGFKNEYYNDAITNPNKYTWGIWDASKEMTPDNWQPKLKQQQSLPNQQPSQNRVTIESSAKNINQIIKQPSTITNPVNSGQGVEEGNFQNNKLLIADNSDNSKDNVINAVNNAVQSNVLLNNQNNNLSFDAMNNNNKKEYKNYFDLDYFK